jgi:hypothetical protein
MPAAGSYQIQVSDQPGLIVKARVLYSIRHLRRQSMIFRKVIKWVGLVVVLMAAVSCYRMPEEEGFNTKPLTNNPAVTREPSEKMIPGVNY